VCMYVFVRVCKRGARFDVLVLMWSFREVWRHLVLFREVWRHLVLSEY